MAKTFEAQRFRALLFVGTLSMLLEYVILLTDNIIVGNMLGERALSAITLLSPFFFFVVFISILISAGSAIVISYEIGCGRQKEACQYFGQGIVLAVASGAVLTIAYLIILYSFRLDMFSVTADVGNYMREYFKYMCWSPILVTLISLLYTVIIYEGNEKLCAWASAVNVIVNVGLSIFLCRIMGIEGVSLGSLISNLIQLLMLMTHFNSKHNTLRFVFYFNVKNALQAFKYSMNDAGTYLYMAILQLVINLFLLKWFGESAIVVFAVVANVFIFILASFDGIGQAASPLLNVYIAEGSQKSIVKTMKTASITALVEGVGVMAALVIFAGLIPRLFGITEPELINQAAIAIRIFSVAAACYSFTMLYSSYYLLAGRVLLSLGITVSSLLVFPIIFGIVFGVFFGLNGVWTGFAVSGAVTAAASALIIKLRFPTITFPLLLDKEKLAKELSYDVPKTKEGIMELVYEVEKDLGEKKVEKNKTHKIMLMIEETQMLALHGTHREGGVVECNIHFDDTITVILRDSGKIKDYLGEEQTGDSEEEFLSKRIIAKHRDKRYVLTGGKNRVIFRF